MRIVRVTSLQWIIGGFLSILGALLLVAPHQYSTPDYPALQQDKLVWGFVFLLIGVGLLASTVFKINRGAVLGLHIIGGVVLLMLSRGFIENRFWLWMVNYVLLGLAVMAIGVIHFLGQARKDRSALRIGIDVIAVFVAINQLLSGALFVFLPAVFTQPRFDLLRPYFVWFGSAYILAALALLAAQLLPQKHPLRRIAYLGAGLIYLVFLILVPLPNRVWQGISFYGLLGVALITLPWLNTLLDQIYPNQLRTRLAMLLTVTMAAPLILTITLVSQQLEGSRQDDALENVENYAQLISHDVGSIIQLHQAGLKQLAATRNLMAMDKATLKTRLQDFAADFPNVIAVAVFTAEGQPVARSDDAAMLPVNGYPVFEQTRQSGQPSIDTLVSPIYKRPIITLGSPVIDESQFVGLAVIALDSAYFAQSIQRMSVSSGMLAYVVNERGLAIAHPDATVPPLADLSATPQVRSSNSSNQISGQLDYVLDDNNFLTGYASIPTLGWTVFVEQPTEVALASVRRGRELAFGILMICLVLTSLFGIILSNWLTRPLYVLQQATREFALGSTTIPLPKSRVMEIQNLADVFGEMRRNLTARTTERERAEDALRTANEALEARVQERTTDLQRSNERLQVELNERLKAEEFLRRRTAEAEEGRRILQALMQHIPAGIAIADDPSGEPRMISRYGQDMLGLNPMEDAGRSDAWAFYWPDGVTRASADELPLVRAIRSGETIHNEEWIIRRANGEKATILCNAGPVHAPDSAIIGGVISWIDITESKRTTEALASYARALARSNKDLQDFASIASHDLQEPLRKIQAFGDKVIKGYQDQVDDIGRDYLQRIQNAARRMQIMIDDLLEYSRVTTHSHPMQMVSLNDVMAEVISNLELRIEQSGGQVKIADLPTIYADHSQMVQLMQNLVGNALKFHHQDVAPEVEVYAQPNQTMADRVKIVVTDNGIGISEQYFERIFQPFQRLHGRGEYEGSGIGLAICRRIVERHNGQISAQSTPGQGARFTVILPLRPAVSQEETS